MRSVYTILLICAAGILVVTAMQSNSDKVISKANGFNRRMAKNDPKPMQTIELEPGHYVIAGISSGEIVLYDFNRPYRGVRINKKNFEARQLTLPIAGQDSFKGLNSLTFQNESYYAISGFTSKIFIISGNHVKITDQLYHKPIYQSGTIDSHSFLFVTKELVNDTPRRVIKKTDYQGRELASYTPEKQLDGYFCTDGQFRIDTESNLLAYMFYFRGELIIMDTMLNVLRHIKTIDTVNTAVINLTSINGSKTHTTPPHIINRKLCIQDGLVYVHSNLRADNQKSDVFRKKETIDVYDVFSGKYLGSFCLPKIGGQRLSYFEVRQDTMYAVYKNIFVLYITPDFKRSKSDHLTAL